MRSFCGLILATLIGFSAFAGSSIVKVTGKMTSNSPTYLSSVDGTFNVKYTNMDLPWGVRVFLHYGFESSSFVSGKLNPTTPWTELGNLELDATSPYTWYGSVVKQLYSRGSSTQLTSLQFVLKVVLPDGTFFYENGGKDSMSYYEVTRPLESPSCPNYTIGAPECPLTIEVKQ